MHTTGGGADRGRFPAGARRRTCPRSAAPMPVPPSARRSTMVTPAPVAAVTTPCGAGGGGEQAVSRRLPTPAVGRRRVGGRAVLRGLPRAKPGAPRVGGGAGIGGRGPGPPQRSRSARSRPRATLGRAGRRAGRPPGPARRQEAPRHRPGSNWGAAAPADALPFECHGPLAGPGAPGRGWRRARAAGAPAAADQAPAPRRGGRRGLLLGRAAPERGAAFSRAAWASQGRLAARCGRAKGCRGRGRPATVAERARAGGRGWGRWLAVDGACEASVSRDGALGPGS